MLGGAGRGGADFARSRLLQILSGIAYVKMAAWEYMVSARLQRKRRKELKAVRVCARSACAREARVR